MAAPIPMLDSYQRVNISSATLAILVDFAAANQGRRLSSMIGDTPTLVDWEDVYAGVLRNGLIGLTYHYLSANPGLDIPTAFVEKIKKAFLIHSLRMTWINRNIKSVLSALNESGIQYLVVKGPAVAFSVFPAANLRVYNDLDLTVHESDWVEVSKALERAGYHLYDGEAAPPPRVVPDEVNHESKYLNAEGNFRVEAHFDDLLRTGFAARDLEGFWKRAIHLEMDGVPFPTLCLEDQIVYLSAHAHHHGYTRLNWFSDIALILRDKAALIDWQKLIDVVKVEEAQVPVYYTLYFIERLFSISTPAQVMDAIRPDRFRRWLHDRLMPPARVLSFEPMVQVFFCFYFYPLFQRLLPDLLVMGRRREKLRFLLHLLVPPREWLRYFYKLKKEGWVDYYYLIHPFKIAEMYWKEIISILSRRRWKDIQI
ncbi:MAG: nucleotidyltransferase family protein [Anaerolineaceae bacterium]|nr:nucleotidyltransferase family protein [Anaerolineaceae bacterium]